MNNKFWRTVENGLDVEVTSHLKMILTYQMLDNHVKLKLIDEKGIDHIEEFARSEKYETSVRSLIIQKKLFCSRRRLESFPINNAYGIFFNDLKNFQFSVGERCMILAMAQFVRDNESIFNSQVVLNGDNDYNKNQKSA